MRGNTNGAHPPSILIPRYEIVERLQRGEPAANLMRDCNIGERVFHCNLDHYGLSDWFRDLQSIRFPGRLMEDEGRLSLLLERIFPRAYEAIQQPTPDNAALLAIRRTQIELLDLDYLIKDIGRRLRYRQEHRTGKKSPVTFSTNRVLYSSPKNPNSDLVP
jgi:hypothetical protein